MSKRDLVWIQNVLLLSGFQRRAVCTLLCTLLQGCGHVSLVDLPSTIHVPTRSAKLRKARQSLRYPALCCHPGTRAATFKSSLNESLHLPIRIISRECRHRTFHATELRKKISKRPVILGPVMRADHDSAWPQRGGIRIVLRLFACTV